jgi:hypothetical protein
MRLCLLAFLTCVFRIVMRLESRFPLCYNATRTTEINAVISNKSPPKYTVVGRFAGGLVGLQTLL